MNYEPKALNGFACWGLGSTSKIYIIECGEPSPFITRNPDKLSIYIEATVDSDRKLDPKRELMGLKRGLVNELQRLHNLLG